MASVQPSDEEVAAAIARTGYVYTDPVDDRASPASPPSALVSCSTSRRRPGAASPRSAIRPRSMQASLDDRPERLRGHPCRAPLVEAVVGVDALAHHFGFPPTPGRSLPPRPGLSR